MQFRTTFIASDHKKKPFQEYSARTRHKTEEKYLYGYCVRWKFLESERESLGNMAGGHSIVCIFYWNLYIHISFESDVEITRVRWRIWAFVSDRGEGERSLKKLRLERIENSIVPPKLGAGLT